MLGPPGPDICKGITEYVLQRNFYGSISTSITAIVRHLSHNSSVDNLTLFQPVESKSYPSLPFLITVALYPMVTLLDSSQHLRCLEDFFASILTIPLLPNRLPFPSLTELSSRLPFSSLNSLLPSVPKLIHVTTAESRVHLIANLSTFTPPRYSKLSSASIDAYLQLLTALLNSLPPGALEPLESGSSHGSSWMVNDSDSDTESHTVVTVVNSFKKSTLPLPDSRTQKRLQTLPSPAHLNSLLTVSQRHPATHASLIAFFVTVNITWPMHKDRILSAVVVSTGGGFVRGLYREYVRSSPLGRDDNPGALTGMFSDSMIFIFLTRFVDPSYSSAWQPLLFLADLYTQSLLTIGDDEFFSTATSSTAPRNPLTLDEIIVFSRKLLNIAFALYWREDQGNIKERDVPGVNMNWELAREGVTKCLLAIHARE